MASTATKLWHNFLIYLPVFLILAMISIIYITYVFTYISVLIDAENTIPANFLLINTSSYSNAKTKGIVLLVITLIFLILLLFSIMKTVITDPGYFPEPSKLECKIAATDSDKNPNFKAMKNKANQKEKNGGKDSYKSYEYLESDIIDENAKEKANMNKTKKNFIESFHSDMENSYSSVKDPKNSGINASSGDNPFKLSVSDYENSKLSITNFTKIVRENPLNYNEYVNCKRDIDNYYTGRKLEINYEENFQKKNNEEIIETNKKMLMEMKDSSNKKSNKSFYYFL